jgi:BON domain
VPAGTNGRLCRYPVGEALIRTFSQEKEVYVRRLGRFPVAFALGAAAVFFLDPRDGARRRHELRDRSLRLLRRAGRWLTAKTKYYGGRAQGVAHEARSAVASPEVATDDATVKQRIMSDALREVGVGSREVEVDVRDGVATLRGTVSSPTLAGDLVARVREVPGVREVAPALTVAETSGAE